MRCFASRHLMTNPVAVNKCANAGAAMRWFAPSALGDGARFEETGRRKAPPDIELRETREGPFPPDRPLIRLASGEAAPLPQAERAGGSLLRRALGLLDARGTEFLALLAVQPFFVGLLRAIKRFGTVRLLGLLGLRCRCGGRRALREGGACEYEGSNGGERRAGRDRHHGNTYRVRKGRQACAARLNPT